LFNDRNYVANRPQT